MRQAIKRQRKLTHSQPAKVLGLSRLETDTVPKEHEVYYDVTTEDIDREAEELRLLRLTQ